MSGYIYIISHPCGLLKVGMSKRPSRRRDQLQRHSYEELTGEFVFRCEHQINSEIVAHNALSEYQVAQEWFSAPLDVAVKVVSDALQLDPEDFPPPKKKDIARALPRDLPDPENAIINQAQCKAARAVLKWSRARLAERVGLTALAIQNFESGGPMRPKNQLAIRKVFEAEDISFPGPKAISWPEDD